MEDQYRDFELYSRALIESKDVDPVYPLVKSIIKEYGFEPEWFVFVYVSFYSLESAIKLCSKWPTKFEFKSEVFRKMRLSGELHHFSHERRGISRNIDNQINSLNRVVSFLTAVEKKAPFSADIRNFNALDFKDYICTFPLFGDWASFKITELFEKSLDYKNLTILDLNLRNRSPNSNDGPVGGLRWLYGRETKYDADIFPVWDRFGENLAKAWGVDLGEVETCLCKWHKMRTGKYWVGHDIAEFVSLKPILGEQRYRRIMSQNFDERFWKSFDKFPKQLKPVYFKTGRIENSDFATELPKIDVLDILMKTE